MLLEDIDKELVDILSLRRQSYSEGEDLLIKKYIIPTGAKADYYGNYILRIGTAPVLWSCHTDTVHKGYEDPRQKLMVVENSLAIMSENSNCLGADNGAGVWLCLQMIKNGVEGLYIFHREEEIGGRGSNFIQKYTPEILEGIKFAVAFDRRGTRSVITHQGTRTCSDQFAEELCAGLGMDHKPDDGGTFTDTANYAGLIPECTNISAGFYKEHTSKEWLDTVYLHQLRDKLLSLNVTELNAYRDVSDHSYPPSYSPIDFENHQSEQWVGGDLIWSYPLKTAQILSSMGILEEVVSELREYEIAIKS